MSKTEQCVCCAGPGPCLTVDRNQGKLPGALTREQVEQAFNAVYGHGDQQGTRQCEVLDGVDALRATIEQQAQELELVKERLATVERERAEARGIVDGEVKGHVCHACDGTGVTYD